MDICYQNLTTLENIFLSDFDNIDSLKIKQRIFRYLNGHKIIFDMLQKGLLVFDSYMEAFRKNPTPELTAKYRLDIADKIVALFKKCHSLLGLFCAKENTNKGLLYENYFNLLLLVNKLDIGQIDLIIEIFKDNKELATMISENHLKFFCNLIVQHGKKETFLKIFDTLLNEPSHETVDLQKKILFVFLNEENLDEINVTILILF